MNEEENHKTANISTQSAFDLIKSKKDLQLDNDPSINIDEYAEELDNFHKKSYKPDVSFKKHNNINCESLVSQKRSYLLVDSIIDDLLSQPPSNEQHNIEEYIPRRKPHEIVEEKDIESPKLSQHRKSSLFKIKSNKISYQIDDILNDSDSFIENKRSLVFINLNKNPQVQQVSTELIESNRFDKENLNFETEVDSNKEDINNISLSTSYLSLNENQEVEGEPNKINLIKNQFEQANIPSSIQSINEELDFSSHEIKERDSNHGEESIVKGTEWLRELQDLRNESVTADVTLNQTNFGGDISNLSETILGGSTLFLNESDMKRKKLRFVKLRLKLRITIFEQIK